MKTITTLFLIILLSVTATAQDVYVAGFVNNGTKDVATLWKNGIAQPPLTNGAHHATGYSVFAENNNVYVGGVQAVSNQIATVWVNGSPVALTNGTSSAGVMSVFVSGGVGYAAGYVWNGAIATATLWVDGVAQSLSNGTHNASANSVFVTSGDVYVAGREYNGSKYVAKYWKNGNEVFLTDGSSDAMANGIFVSGNNVHVVGYTTVGTGSNSYKVATVWTNGVSYMISRLESEAISVFKKDNQVYVTGYAMYQGDQRVIMWMNGSGQFINLPSNNGVGRSIYVSGALPDVYIAGYESNGTHNVAKLWKNGVQQILSSGGTEAGAFSVFVDDETLSVEAPKRLPDFLTVYPNPAQSLLHIKTSKPCVLQLYNLQGQLLNTIEVTNQHKTIDITNLSSGLYLLKDIDTGDTQKIIKE
ncbi:MAG: T9SS type A sorting domain-containing protein [Xanthomarina gelatinilytica]|uniref:T9SS type A sorting domain-containing protein n=1 Tax=Xanthomarina gelatinilytica TaxID=1137281 RepID=UPI003A862CE1